jgi:16S rRNA (cytosine967-C5)-methyltransferase
VTGPAEVVSRQVALDALVAIEADQSFANLKLGPLLERSGLDDRDRRFVTELVYGTIRRRRAVDFLVDRFIVSPPSPVARAALRLGAYQLGFTDVPDHAAVSATVDVTPKRYRGLVNAVLRRVARNPVEWPDEATRLSYPDWVLERLGADLGHDVAIEALETMNRAPDVTVRADGYTQDRSSARVVAAVGAGRGDLVIDVCAAPGGKATGLVAAGATVVAADRRWSRVRLLAGNIERTRSGASGIAWPMAADATRPAIRPGIADVVLVDAPCSGLGVLRRRPDARWRVTADDVASLAALQRRILGEAASLVRPGGRIVYSVCTLTRAETVEVAEWFGECYHEFEPADVPGDPWRPWGSGALLLPQADDSDGMALFAWQRSS